MSSVKDEVQKFEIILQEKSAALSIALPQHVDAARYMRLCLNAVIRNPKLLSYDKASLAVAMMNAAETGLDPQNGEIYFVPRKGSVAAQVGYKGFVQLGYRSNQIAAVSAGVVCEKDKFDFTLGTEPQIAHIFSGTRGEPTFAWACITTKAGGKLADVMTIDEVRDVQARSDANKAHLAGKIPPTPWQTDFDAMAKKTVLRRLYKLAPISAELARAVQLDEEGEILTPEDCKGAKDIVADGLKNAKPMEDLFVPSQAN